MFKCESDIGADYCQNWGTLATTEGSERCNKTDPESSISPGAAQPMFSKAMNHIISPCHPPVPRVRARPDLALAKMFIKRVISDPSSASQQ